ncbi:MAG TPA: hypothetical protein VFG83_05655 [Kofleriaceae bacterium]|nr:hypothetical protein [Kofleriaceae bacterium]
MAPQRWILTLGALAALAPLARADVSNRNLLPMGEREALLANAGITSATGGAAFYNPANLARIEHPSLSMTGTTLLRFDLSSDAFLVIEGVDQPFEASGFLTVPASLVSTYKVGSWSLATSVLVPDVFEISNLTSFDTASRHTTLLLKSSAQELWLGASAAHAIVDDVYAGISVFGSQSTTASTTMYHIVDTTMPNTATQVTSNRSLSVVGLTAVAGLYWQAHPKFGVGARVQTPLVKLTGSADLYNAVLTSGAMDAVSEVELDDVDANRALPWDVGVGVSMKPADRVEVLIDVNVQLPETYTELEDPAVAGDPIKLETAVRVSAATEIAVTDSVDVQLGLLYNGSANPTPVASGDVRETYFGATAGLSWQSGRTRTGVGAFFFNGDADTVPLFDPAARLVSSSVHLIGALITVAYSL